MLLVVGLCYSLNLYCVIVPGMANPRPPCSANKSRGPSNEGRYYTIKQFWLGHYLLTLSVFECSKLLVPRERFVSSAPKCVM